jgi:uncharacterized membrane protein YfcA
MDVVLFGTLVIIGAVSGVLIGSIGMGGGVVMTPLLMLAGVPLKGAIAIGLALQMVPQSVFGVIEYWKCGHLDVVKAVAVTLGSTVGIYVGAFILNRGYVSEKTTCLCISVFMVAMGVYMFLRIRQ